MGPLRVSVALIAFSLAAPALSEPFLVRNIRTTPVSSDSTPRGFSSLAGVGYFLADDVERRVELWRSDGSEAGTSRVRALCEGSCDVGTADLESVGNLLFLRAYSDPSRTSGVLWRSDGTTAGTFPLSGFEIDEFGVIGYVEGIDRYFIEAKREAGGREYWRSDGTVAGTTKLVAGDTVFVPGLATLDERALLPSQDSVWRVGASGPPEEAFTFSGVLTWRRRIGAARLFVLVEGGERSLWRTDGTAAGTLELAGATFSTIRSTSPELNGRVLLFAQGSPSGQELWRTDGTAAGTVPVRTFAGAPLLGYFVALGGDVYFLADDGTHGVELWRSDGSAAGTVLVADSCPGACGFATNDFELIAAGAELLIWGRHQTSPEMTLFEADRTGVEAALDRYCPGSCQLPRPPVVFGDRVLFVGQSDQGEAGEDLWISDGTAARTRVLGSFPLINAVAPLGSGFALIAAYEPAHGREPWATDGTRAGTQLLRDIAVGGDAGSEPDFFAVDGDRAYFSAIGDDGALDLWKVDAGSPNARRLGRLRPFGEGAGPVNGRVIGGRLLLSFRRKQSIELWTSDGSPSGTARLTTFPTLPDLESAATVGEVTVLAVGETLWRTDGTKAGTFQLSEGIVSSRLVAQGSKVFFAHDVALGSTDGSVAGTALLWSFDDPDLPHGLDALVGLAGQLYFTSDSLNGFGLWRSDGTAAGTVGVVGLGSRDVEALLAAGDFFYFVRDDISGGPFSLWRSDGTTAGTIRLLKPVGSTIFSAQPVADAVALDISARGVWSDGSPEGTRLLSSLPEITEQTVVAGDLAYFVTQSSDEGGRLWRSDGSDAGTFPLAPAGSIAAVNDRVVFGFEVGSAGAGIGVSDGSLAGTSTLAEFGPGARGVSELTPTSEVLYFQAGGSGLGHEPWALPIWDLFASDPTQLRLGDLARFRVEIEWSDGRRSGKGQVVPLRTADSGLFWFFDDDNWELLVKVIDACELFDRYWVFSAATTDVEYTLTVTDTETGAVRRYPNTLGHPATPVADTDAFATCAAKRATAATPPAPVTKSTCADGQGLCLGPGGRYRATITWDDGQRQGAGNPVAGSADSGLFWFFAEDNWELLVKVLDTCGFDPHRWVFAAATTNVGFVLTVEDTLTGATRRYENRDGHVAETITDTSAFDCD